MFRLIKKILLFIWFVFMILIGLWLAFDNDEFINVNLFGWTMPSLSIGSYLVLFLLLGVILGGVTSTLLNQKKLISKKRELSKVQKEIKQIRSQQMVE